jgi:hypothetical protein
VSAREIDLVAYVLARCTIDDGGCLLWRLAVNNDGRPVANLRGFGMLDPRRVMVEAKVGPLPPGRLVLTPACHPRCVEPTHAETITRKGLAQRLAREGRLASGPLVSARMRKLARSRPHVKLDEDKVRALRQRYAETGNAALVAREFGISHSHAHRVCTHVWWRETTPFSGLMAGGP